MLHYSKQLTWIADNRTVLVLGRLSRTEIPAWMPAIDFATVLDPRAGSVSVITTAHGLPAGPNFLAPVKFTREGGAWVAKTHWAYAQIQVCDCGALLLNFLPFRGTSVRRVLPPFA